MEVENLGASGPTKKYPGYSILKLYDWRYATQLRRDQKIDQRNQSHEEAYREILKNGSAAAEFIATLDDNETDP